MIKFQGIHIITKDEHAANTQRLIEALRKALLQLDAAPLATQITVTDKQETSEAFTALLIDTDTLPQQELSRWIAQSGERIFLLQLSPPPSIESFLRFCPVYPFFVAEDPLTLHLIAHELACDLLQRQKQPDDTNKTLFLFPAPAQQAPVRGRIKQDFYAQGFSVLPDALCTAEQPFKIIERCRAAVHLLPEENNEQWQLFCAQSREHALEIHRKSQLNGRSAAFYRFFWTPPEQSRQGVIQQLIDEIEQKESDVPVTEMLVLPTGQLGHYLREYLEAGALVSTSEAEALLPILVLTPPEDEDLMHRASQVLSQDVQDKLHFSGSSQALQHARHILMVCINGSTEWLISNIFHILKLRSLTDTPLHSLCLISSHELVIETGRALPLQFFPLHAPEDLPLRIKEWEEKINS